MELKIKQILTKGWISKVDSINPKPSNKYGQQKSDIEFLTIPVHHNICNSACQFQTKVTKIYKHSNIS